MKRDEKRKDGMAMEWNGVKRTIRKTNLFQFSNDIVILARDFRN